MRAAAHLDRDIARRLAEVADLVCELWREPDAGIWEVRSEQRHFTQSKMMCWIALDRAAEIAGGRDPRTPRRPLARGGGDRRVRRDALLLRQKRSYVRAADSDELDASLLLGVVFSYGDPRGAVDATIAALRRARPVRSCAATPARTASKAPRARS